MTGEAARTPLFRRALAERWWALPPAVRAFHSVARVQDFRGVATIARGTTPVARLAAWLFGFPPAAEEVPLTVRIATSATGEVWTRDFGGRTLRSRCLPSAAPYRYRESFGPLTCELDLQVVGGCMHVLVRRGWLLGIPMPRPLLPRSESREFESGGAFGFDIAAFAPFGGGLIVRYRGWLRPDRLSHAPARSLAMPDRA